MDVDIIEDRYIDNFVFNEAYDIEDIIFLYMMI